MPPHHYTRLAHLRTMTTDKELLAECIDLCDGKVKLIAEWLGIKRPYTYQLLAANGLVDYAKKVERDRKNQPSLLATAPFSFNGPLPGLKPDITAEPLLTNLVHLHRPMATEEDMERLRQTIAARGALALPPESTLGADTTSDENEDDDYDEDEDDDESDDDEDEDEDDGGGGNTA